MAISFIQCFPKARAFGAIFLIPAFNAIAFPYVLSLSGLAWNSWMCTLSYQHHRVTFRGRLWERFGVQVNVYWQRPCSFVRFPRVFFLVGVTSVKESLAIQARLAG